jgi:hypothetical protein
MLELSQLELQALLDCAFINWVSFVLCVRVLWLHPLSCLSITMQQIYLFPILNTKKIVTYLFEMGISLNFFK